MIQQKITQYGKELLNKTYNDNCQIMDTWQRVDSPKLKSLYLPYFINTFEIIASRNELMFDLMLNNINLYFNQEMLIYMANYDKQVIYHTNIYMIINRNPSSSVDEWTKLL